MRQSLTVALPCVRTFPRVKNAVYVPSQRALGPYRERMRFVCVCVVWRVRMSPLNLCVDASVQYTHAQRTNTIRPHRRRLERHDDAVRVFVYVEIMRASFAFHRRLSEPQETASATGLVGRRSHSRSIHLPPSGVQRCTEDTSTPTHTEIHIHTYVRKEIFVCALCGARNCDSRMTERTTIA